SASYLFRAANIWREMEAAGVPDIRGVWMMPSGSSYFLAVVSITQRYSGHARQAGLAAMSGRAGGGNYRRLLIVLDDDSGPPDQDRVLWALATGCDPERAITIVPDCTSGYLDPALPPEKRARHEYTSSRAVLDACKPYHWKKEFPLDVGTSPELKARI